jgi:translation elongation factor EF-Ts
MTDAEPAITYLMIREVRAETGASHEECRRALEESGGDVSRAAALWFARKRPGAAPVARPAPARRHPDPTAQPERN